MPPQTTAKATLIRSGLVISNIEDKGLIIELVS
jgi:hypothetical protein